MSYSDEYLRGMRDAALILLEQVALKAKQLAPNTGLAVRTDAEASATPSKQGDAS